MTTRPSLTLATLALLYLPLDALASGPAGPGQLKRFVSEKPAYSVYRPDTWRVHHESAADSFRIVVADAEGLAWVELYFAGNRANRLDALGLLGARSRELRLKNPDVRLSEALVCKDLSCVSATLSYTRESVPWKERFYTQTDPQQMVIRSFGAPASRWTAQRNLMLEILANIRLGPAPAAAGANRTAPPAPPPLQVQLVPRRAADGSLTISVPQDWIFQGQAGKVLAVAPEGSPCAGFIFTSFQLLPPSLRVPPAPDVLLSAYVPPSQTIQLVFQRFGNRNVRLLGPPKPDAQAAAACLQQLRRPCDVEQMALSWVSPKGASCMGGFFVLNNRPNVTGIWTSLVAGGWGPAQDLARYTPMLHQIGQSFAINNQFAANYIHQGMINLQHQMQRTQEAMRSLNQAREDNQRAWEQRQERKDAMDAKWDDYRRGNSYWISELEGGKVYQTDRWGTHDTWTGDRFEGPPHDYVHFEGQNPRHPSENMREVSSYELQQLTGGRP